MQPETVKISRDDIVLLIVLIFSKLLVPGSYIKPSFAGYKKMHKVYQTCNLRNPLPGFSKGPADGFDPDRLFPQ